MSVGLLFYIIVELSLHCSVGTNLAGRCEVRDYGCEIEGQLTMICHYNLPQACSRFTATLQYYPSGHPAARGHELNLGTKRGFHVPDVDHTRNYTHILRLWDPSTNSTSSTTTITFNPQNIMKPYPVRGVSENVTGSELLLRWSAPDDGESHCYRVNLTGGAHSHSQVSETRLTNLTVHHLRPASSWHVEVCQKYTNKVGHPIGLWSEPAIASVTIPDGIAATPRLVPAVSRSGDTEVTIYWQCLSREEEHGRLEHYLLEWAGEIAIVKAEDRPCSHTLTLPVPHPASFTVRLSAVNNVGTSPSAQLTILQKDTEPSPPEFRVWREGERVVSRWEEVVEVEGDPSNCTVVWCLTSASRHLHSCPGAVYWVTMRCDQQSAVLPVDLTASHRLVTGLSLARRHARSSISWTACLYTTTALRVVEKFEGAETHPPGGVEVRWGSGGCYNTPYIWHYLLVFCPVPSQSATCTGKEKEIVIARSQTEYRVEKLLPGEMYRLTIRAVSLNHTVGPRSAALTVRVQDDSTSPGIIWSVVTVVIVIVTVVLVVIWFVRRCRIAGNIPISNYREVARIESPSESNLNLQDLSRV